MMVLQKSSTACFLLKVKYSTPYLKCLEGSENISHDFFSCWKKEEGSQREGTWRCDGDKVPQGPQSPALPSPAWHENGNPAQDESTATSSNDFSQLWFSLPFEYRARSLLKSVIIVHPKCFTINFL